MITVMAAGFVSMLCTVGLCRFGGTGDIVHHGQGKVGCLADGEDQQQKQTCIHAAIRAELLSCLNTGLSSRARVVGGGWAFGMTAGVDE